jgi:Flp pilus assembly pilin Flp
MDGCTLAQRKSLRLAVSHRLAGFWIQRRAFRSEQGQATVEYLLVIGVVVVAVAAAFYQRQLFEALALVFNSIAYTVSKPFPRAFCNRL